MSFCGSGWARARSWHGPLGAAVQGKRRQECRSAARGRAKRAECLGHHVAWRVGMDERCNECVRALRAGNKGRSAERKRRGERGTMWCVLMGGEGASDPQAYLRLHRPVACTPVRTRNPRQAQRSACALPSARALSPCGLRTRVKRAQKTKRLAFRPSRSSRDAPRHCTVAFM